ncbi:MAG: hypothetical protein WC497_04345 [Patescibacteria group bacterium]
MSKKTKHSFLAACCLIILSLAFLFTLTPVQADDSVNIGISPSIQTELGIPKDLASTVVKVAQYVIGFLAFLSVVLLIYAGFTWMTAAGNEEKIATAKKTITAAVIGIAIVLLAGAIVAFVVTAFVTTA